MTETSPEHEDLKRRLVVALQRRRDRRREGELPRPLPAAVIARRFGVRPGGGRDSQRRGVRVLIRELRDQDGVPVLSDGRGYYLAADAADYEAAERYAQRSGLGQLARAAAMRRHPERSDASGQLGLPF